MQDISVLCHLGWADLRSRMHCMEARPHLDKNCALNRCEECFNRVWTVQLTQHCLYMDSPGYIKHSNMTRNPRTKQQDKGKKCLAYSHTVLNRGICKFVGAAIQWTFEHTLVSSTASHREQQHFKYAWTRSNIVYAQLRKSRLHACKLCKEKYLPLLGPKTCSSLFLLAFFDLGW